jgi:hypothetical protein
MNLNLLVDEKETLTGLFFLCIITFVQVDKEWIKNA